MRYNLYYILFGYFFRIDSGVVNWCCPGFEEECRACLREAEDAEEKELRAATDRKMAAAAEEDAISLRLPDAVAQEVLFVASAADLDDAEQRLCQLLQAVDCNGNIFESLAQKGRALGLDAEWKPFLEKPLAAELGTTQLCIFQLMA